MVDRGRINRRFITVALWEALAICCGLGAIAAFRRGTAIALSLALTLLVGVALATGAGIQQTRGLLADLSGDELVEEPDGADADLGGEERRRPGPRA